MTTGCTNELELAQLFNRNFGHRSELSLSDDSVAVGLALGLALYIFQNDYLLQSESRDDEESSESEIIEEESEDNCDLRVTDATAALEQADTHQAVIVVDTVTESSTMSMTEFAKQITCKLIHKQQAMST